MVPARRPDELDAGLEAMLRVSDDYSGVQRLVTAGTTTAADMIAWAAGVRAEPDATAAVLRARSALMLAVYHEHLAVHGTPCAFVLQALDNPAFVHDLNLTPMEVKAVRILASGLVHGAVTDADGIEYLFSAAMQQQSRDQVMCALPSVFSMSRQLGGRLAYVALAFPCRHFIFTVATLL